MFEGLRRFSSVKARAFLLPTIEVVLVGRRRMGRHGVAGRGGAAALKSAWWDRSFIGWKGSRRSCEGLRTWMRGSFSHIDIREMSCYSALAPSLHQHIRKYTHKTRLHIQVNKHTLLASYTHAFTHNQQTHTQKTHFGFLFICWLAR